MKAQNKEGKEDTGVFWNSQLTGIQLCSKFQGKEKRKGTQQTAV